MFQLIQQKATVEPEQDSKRVDHGTCASQLIRFSWGGTYRGIAVDLDPAVQIGECTISVARGHTWNR